MADSGLSLGLAIWGALTGTVACARTGWQWLHDRPNIKVDAHVSITNTDINGNVLGGQMVVLFVTLVNIGHRQASIKNISVPLTKATMLVLPGMTPEQIESYREGYEGRIELFGGRDETPFELKPDGGIFKRHAQLSKSLPILPNKNKPSRATVTVELTSGKKILGTFELLPDDKWPSNG